MDRKALIAQAKTAGYQDVQVVSFPADSILDEHIHDEETIHILLSGEMTLIENGKVDELVIGKVFIIPAGTKHHGTVGSKGCTFVVGFKHEDEK